MDSISSKDNRILKQAAALKEKKYRDSLGMYLVEGPNFIRDAFLYGGRLRFIFTRAGALSAELEDIIRLAGKSGSAVYSLTDECFAKLSDSVSSQGIIGVAEKRQWSEDELFKEDGANVLVLDRVQDPGNLGTMLRTAEAMGFAGAVLMKGCCDVYGPKAARACAGSLFRLPLLFIGDEAEALELFRRRGKRLYAAVMDGELSCMDAELSQNAAIVIGNEGNGVSEGFIRAATGLRIPMAGSIESLNAAAASAMLMYEAYRQKLK
jgi:TrmH family RNA methyltransferase